MNVGAMQRPAYKSGCRKEQEKKRRENNVMTNLNDSQEANVTANFPSQEVAGVTEGAFTTCEKEDHVNNSEDILHVFMCEREPLQGPSHFCGCACFVFSWCSLFLSYKRGTRIENDLSYCFF